MIGKIILELGTLLVFSYIIRFIFTIARSTDDDTHFWNVQRIMDKQYFKNSDSIIPGKRSFPPLTSAIIALFPRKFTTPIGKNLNIFYDLATITTVYFLTLSISNASTTIAFMVGIIFSTTPIFFPVESRLRVITSRTLGLFLVAMFMISFYYGLAGRVLGFAAALVFSILIVLTSFFSLQVIIFFLLFSTIFYSYVPLVFLAVFVVVAFSIRLCRGILHRKIKHWIWYFRNINKIGMRKSRNRIIDMLLIPYYILVKPKEFLRLMTRDNSLLILAISVPMLFIFVPAIAKNYSIIGQPHLFYLYSIVITMALTFILTSLRPFTFLGEAERYFEVAVFPILVISFAILQQGYDLKIMTVFVLLLHIIVILLTFIYLNISMYRSALNIDKEFAKAVNYLKKCKGNLISLMPKLAFRIASHCSNKKIKYYYNFMEVSDEKHFDYMEEDQVLYNILRSDIDKVIEKYDINIIFIDRRWVDKVAKNKKIKYNLSKYKKAFSNNEYEIYLTR